jgi:hypothetical protein
MALVKVWNDNKYPHVEKYQGRDIEIGPGDFIEMDYDDALQFQGKFKPPMINGQGHDPRGFKKIRVERPPVAKANPLMNHVTGQTAESSEELKAAMAQYKHLQVKHEEENEQKLREATEEHSKALDKFTETMNAMNDKIAQRDEEINDLKNAMKGAPFNLTDQDMDSMVKNNKGDKNANRSGNAKR